MKGEMEVGDKRNAGRSEVPRKEWRLENREKMEEFKTEVGKKGGKRINGERKKRNGGRKKGMEGGKRKNGERKKKEWRDE